MVWRKDEIIFFMVVMLGGVIFSSCAYSKMPATKYRDEYRSNVRQKMQEEIQSVFHRENQIPIWHPPLVQEVLVPAQSANGMYIPEHKELVIIKPGQWVIEPLAPNNTPKEAYEAKQIITHLDMADLSMLPSNTSPDDKSSR